MSLCDPCNGDAPSGALAIVNRCVSQPLHQPPAFQVRSQICWPARKPDEMVCDCTMTVFAGSATIEALPKRVLTTRVTTYRASKVSYVAIGCSCLARR